jgi:uncharacterized membrane protein YccC
LIRLEHANWALFTVLVLAPAQYVGAIAQRSIARVVGTIIGGFVGVWLVGNYEQDRLFFLVFVFVYISFCMYMYGGSIFPYAFFLCANALMTVSANGIFDPNNAWHIGLGRVLEILTGVVSILVVANLIWPRFVRHDFIGLTRAALVNVEKLVGLQHESLASGTDLWNEARTTAIALREQSLKLRALLQNGANESLYFRRRLPSYTMAVVSLVHLLQASLDLFRRQKGRPQYLDDVGTELFAVHEAIEREFQMLGDALESRTPVKDDRLETTFHALEARLREVHAAGIARKYSLEDALDLANHYAALGVVNDELLKLRALLVDLPLPGDPPRRDKPREFRFPRIDLNVAMFFVVATVSLNAEQPVAVETVFGSYFGVVLPIFIAAIVGRLFWPILPESELRKRLIEFFFLSLAHRLEVIADDLESCRNQALALTIEDYWGDYLL